MIQRCEKYYPYTLSVVAAEYLGETADSVVMEPVAPSERTPVENRVMKALGRRTNTDYT
jgi:mitochondrial fission protein ELM1